MIPDLFEAKQRDVVLGGFARPFEGPLIAALQRLVKVAPFDTWSHLAAFGCRLR